MVVRRDLLLGAAALAAAGLAYELKPRKHKLLLQKSKMAAVVPIKVGAWSAEAAPNLITPDTTGKLAAMLYSELVERVYTNADTGREVMMLIAYGDTQSDLLQLHRPESCYPAVGYNLALSAPTQVALGDGAALPSRKVIARKGDRQENIIYWTRLGEYLPASARDQKVDRLRAAMSGVIPDGALFRFSEVGDDAQRSFDGIDVFIRDLVMAVAPGQRQALLGTRLAGVLGTTKA
jgi:EpsI family protein